MKGAITRPIVGAKKIEREDDSAIRWNQAQRRKFKQKKVKLLCPEGHDLYPNGIGTKTLYDNFGVRLSADQKVKKEEARFISVVCMSGNEQDALKELQEKKAIASMTIYQLSSAQFKLLKRVCKECKLE